MKATLSSVSSNGKVAKNEKFRLVHEFPQFIEYEAANVTLDEVYRWAKEIGVTDIRLFVKESGMFSLDSEIRKAVLAEDFGEMVTSTTNIVVKGYLTDSVMGRLVERLGLDAPLFVSTLISKKDSAEDNQESIKVGSSDLFLVYSDMGVVVANISKDGVAPISVPLAALLV